VVGVVGGEVADVLAQGFQFMGAPHNALHLAPAERYGI
jgi:hypothetical protein